MLQEIARLSSSVPIFFLKYFARKGECLLDWSLSVVHLKVVVQSVKSLYHEIYKMTRAWESKF